MNDNNILKEKFNKKHELYGRLLKRYQHATDAMALFSTVCALAAAFCLQSIVNLNQEIERAEQAEHQITLKAQRADKKDMLLIGGINFLGGMAAMFFFGRKERYVAAKRDEIEKSFPEFKLER